ncbi:NAD(+)/NADH kinase [bacterium]|nr:NAD(+)/NADH kinase [bacterium]
MGSNPLRFVLLTRDNSERIQRSAESLVRFLASRPGTELVAAAVVEEVDGDLCATADLVIVLGGDGAILRACRKLGDHQRPIIGINRGRLGFLADLSFEEFCDRFEEIRTGALDITDHLMFEAELRSADGSTETFLGLNEAAVSAGAALQMVEVELRIDDLPVTRYSCDGLIICTPVGSTAHSLSAGGPAIRQDLDVFLVTPICPHTLSNRCLVDDANRTYRLTLPDARTDVVLVIDGQIRRPFRVGDEVIIRRAKPKFRLARLAGHNYYSVLQHKLGWSGQPRYASSEYDD